MLPKLLPALVHSAAFSCLLLAGTTAMAQKPAFGYVLTTGGDTLKGAIILRDRLLQQMRVEFVPLRGEEVLVLDAYQLAGYCYYEQDKLVRYVALPFYQDGSNIPSRGFLRQLVAGEVQLYDYAYLPVWPRRQADLLLIPQSWDKKYPTFGPLSRKEAEFASQSSNRCIVAYRAGAKRLEEVSWWDLRQDAATYFADYPALATDLRAGRYRKRDIAKIVQQYNTWYQGAKSDM